VVSEGEKTSLRLQLVIEGGRNHGNLNMSIISYLIHRSHPAVLPQLLSLSYSHLQMRTSLYISFLLGGMILSYLAMVKISEKCSDPNPSNHVVFEQPVWQTLQNFGRQMFCFLPVVYMWLIKLCLHIAAESTIITFRIFGLTATIRWYYYM